MEGLPASGALVRRLCGGLEGWPVGHLMAATFTGGGIQDSRHAPIHKLL